MAPAALARFRSALGWGGFSQNSVSLQSRGKDAKCKIFRKPGKKWVSSLTAEKSKVSPDATSQKPGLSLDEVRCYLLQREGNR